MGVSWCEGEKKTTLSICLLPFFSLPFLLTLATARSLSRGSSTASDWAPSRAAKQRAAATAVRWRASAS